MGYIGFFPCVNTGSELSDLVYRASWHLNFLSGFQFVFYSSNKNLTLSDIRGPSGFSPEVEENVDDFKNKIKIVYVNNGIAEEHVRLASAIIKWKEDNADLNKFLKEHAKCTIYRTDSKLVRQEGSFYIQCAFDLLQEKEQLIAESSAKFSKLYNKLGTFARSWVLATGPSVENYVDHDFDNCLTIACNSTVLDDDLVRKCDPKILVFADPIFHFGVSEYAGEFRKVVANRLDTTDITIIVPFKYYALLLSVFPDYSERIIGVPFNHEIDFNVDISKDFIVKTTSNILTLLLLPVASTFSDSVNILGCDGRSFDDDDYFWGHGKTVQINSKMQNIQEVHPGFFKIDYNEYYYEHCHTLECQMQKSETFGKQFVHHANSFIPALRDRNALFRLKSQCSKRHCIMIEPDGVGMFGHYVTWYNQVIDELKQRDNSIRVFCNKKQDTSLYNANSNNIFTSHSWGISRADWCYKKNFSEHPSFKNFFEELGSAIQSYCNETSAEEITIFMYYGSVQILYGLHVLRKELKQRNIKLDVSLCLFHESVIFESSIKVPRLPPNARAILLEGLAQSDSYRIASVTDRLKDNLYERLGVLTNIMPNPMPNPMPIGTYKSSPIPLRRESESVFRVVFPCALREEKGSRVIEQFAKDIVNSKIESTGFEFHMRKFEDVIIDDVDNISWIKDKLSDNDYQELLQSADAIVIPYLAPQFTFRTSGIIVDVMHMQKPLVVIEGTWLADVVKQYFCGLSIEPFSSYSIMSAVHAIKDNAGILDKYTTVCYEKYLERNSWERLVEIMFDR